MWSQFTKWFMAVVVGTVRRIFRGGVDTKVPTGPAPSPPEGNYPKIVQLSIARINEAGFTLFYELDRDGELLWGVFAAALADSISENDVKTGNYATTWGVNNALKGEFKEYPIDTLAQGTEYTFIYLTRDENAESDILDRIDFKTDGDDTPGATLREYSDDYELTYG